MSGEIKQAILVDDNDNILGYKEVLQTHQWPALLHRAISVLIFNEEKILLQKRSEKKPVWPLYWSNTVCGNVLKDESYLECAKRRLQQEMGIVTDLTEKFKFKYRRRFDKKYGEQEMDTVFVGNYGGKVVANPADAADYKWMNVENLKKDFKKNPQIYTPWFKMICKKLEII